MHGKDVTCAQFANPDYMDELFMQKVGIKKCP